ncbi:MAG: hypothetical protein LC747_07890 [Acidobacteria bacterium]|nr:hypothetical protein [Acidobacteriota bacterium]
MIFMAGALALALGCNSLAVNAVVAQRQRRPPAKAAAARASLNAKIGRFAPTVLMADTSRLSAGDRRALSRIIEAAKLMDPLYLRQVWGGNPALLARLQRDKSALGYARLHYFRINVGPWSRLDGNEPFIEGVPGQKPHHANYYPDDMTKEEFNTWVQGRTEAEKERATGFFHLIRRDAASGKLQLVPYSTEYREFLEPAARLLREAAELTTNATLKSFLSKRADAFLSDDYYESDVAWMDLDAPIDVTIGPYETYEDELFNYKAAFEAYVTLRDDAETAKLAKFSGYLQELEDNLPLEARYRNPKLGAASPIRVVNEVFSSGEGNRGVQTAAKGLALLRVVLHTYPRTRVDARAGAAQHQRGRRGDDRAQAIEGTLLGNRRGEGRYHRPLGVAVFDGQGDGGKKHGAFDVHDLPRKLFSLRAFRHHGGARQRHRRAVQLSD